MYRTTALPRLDPGARAALTAFYQSARPMPDGYYDRRLASGVYDAVLTAESDGDLQLSGAQLLNVFDEGDRRFVYLGPLASQRHVYSGMIAHLVAELHAQAGDKMIVLMAEVQNPLIAVLLAYAFGPACVPGIGTSPATLADRELVGRFCRRLPHVDPIDWRTLSTRSTSTMWKEHPLFAPVSAWYARRGVDFAAGQSQVMLIKLDAGFAARETQIEAIVARTRPLVAAATKTVIRDVLSWFQQQILLEESTRACAQV